MQQALLAARGGLLAARCGVLAARDTGAILLYGSLLIVALIVLGTVVLWLRRKYLADEAPQVDGVWSLQQLRDLRITGEISEDEFQRLRAEMIGRHALRSADTQESTGVDAPADEEGNQIKQPSDDSR